jgi:hypothetical protein
MRTCFEPASLTVDVYKVTFSEGGSIDLAVLWVFLLTSGAVRHRMEASWSIEVKNKPWTY